MCAAPILLAVLVALGAGRAGAQPAPPDPLVIEATFQDSLAAMEAGAPRAAVPGLRAILAGDPQLVRVRLELARAYFLDGDFEQARREFLIVLSGDLPPPVRAAVLDFIRRIDAQKAFIWGFDFGIEVNPDAGRDYDTDIVELEVLGQRLPFVLDRVDPPLLRAVVTGTAEFQKPVGAGPAGSAMTAFASGRADLKEAASTAHDEQILTLRSGLRFTWPQLTVSVAPALRVRRYAGEHLDDRVLLEASGEYRTGAGLSVFGRIAGGWLEANGYSEGSGEALSGGFGARRSLGGRSLVGVAVSGKYFDARSAAAGYRDIGVEAFGSTEIMGGFTIAPSIYVRRFEAFGAAPLFDDPRAATEFGADLDVLRNDVLIWGRYSPFVAFGLSRRESVIDAFSYTERRFLFGLRRSL